MYLPSLDEAKLWLEKLIAPSTHSANLAGMVAAMLAWYFGAHIAEATAVAVGFRSVVSEVALCGQWLDTRYLKRPP